jgi:hypothetical protein
VRSPRAGRLANPRLPGWPDRYPLSTMTTVAPFTSSRTPGAAEADRVARLGLVDDLGANLADLTDAPQTIGGGPRCSVRLGATGLRPLHCVITPSQDGPVVRRWAAETRLNGRDFTEAALTAGDLLRIGSIDLRVVALPSDLSNDGPSDLPAGESPKPAALKTSLTDEVPLVQSTKSDTPDIDPVAASLVVLESPLELEGAVEPEWFDDGAEDSADEIATAVEVASPAPALDFDPAIPSRLLRPWAPEKPMIDQASSEPLLTYTKAEADSSDDPFAAFGGFSAEPAQVEEAAAVNDTAYGVLLQQPAFVEEAPAIVGAELDADNDPWRVASPADAVAEPVAAFDEIAAAAFGADAVVSDVEPDYLAPAEQSPAEPWLVEGLRVRAAASRARVSRLVTALRAERRQSGELTSVVTDLATQLEQALAATDEAGAELARLAAERTAISEDLVATRDALDGAIRRAELLEAHVTVLEASLAAMPLAPEPSAVADFADQHEPAAEATVEDAIESEWDYDADAVPVFADEVLEEVSAETRQEDPFAWRTDLAAEATEAADEPLWGIERLAATEERSLIDSPWVGVVAEQPTAESAEETRWDDEPVATVPVAAEFDDAPRAALEPVAVAYEDEEPTATLPEPVDTASEYEDTSSQSNVELWGAAEERVEEPVAAPKPEPQVSFIERFAHLVPEEDEPIQRPAAIAAVPTAPASDDDDSIDDYMRKLMQRVRGASANEENPVPARKPTLAAMVSETADEDRHESAQTQPVEAPPAKQEMLRDLSELRRGPAPEQMTNMGALRQLANQSARHAIDVAASRQSREKATMRLAVSVISVAVGTLASIVSPSPLDLQFIGGFTSVVIGGWFFVRTVRQCQVRTLDQQIALAAKHAG